MSYTDFSFYLNEYLGTVITDNEQFKRLEKRACAKLDMFTFGRIGEATNAVRLAVCAMCEVLYWEEQRKTDGREIASESNDGFSITFASASEEERLKLTEQELYRTAYSYLSRTELMDFTC